MTWLVLLLAQEFAYDEWEAWNSFKEGSRVTHSTSPASLPVSQTATLSKKEAGRISIDVSHSGPNPGPGEVREIDKKVEGARCAACQAGKKVHKKPDRKVIKEKEKVTVGKEELECTLVEEKLFTCEGKDLVTRKAWYCKEVPGWLVKAEWKQGKTTYTTECTSYVRK